jgi:hypothetical protein
MNNRVINRSNYLSGYSYGKNFIYTERMPVANAFIAVFIGLMTHIFVLCAMTPFLRPILRYMLPKQGEGPSVQALNKGNKRRRQRVCICA